MGDSAVSAFERIKHTDERGDYWPAREPGKLLGHDKWQTFLTVLHEAMEVCRIQGGGGSSPRTGSA